MSFSIREPRTRVSISVRSRFMCGVREGLARSILAAGIGGQECPPHTTSKSPPRVSLEQRGRAALPGFAFFFGDVFHIGDVGSGLSQDVVQVVADADEGESFFEEFA